MKNLNDKVTQFKGTVYENGYGLIAKKVMKDTELSIGSKGLYAYICAYAGNENKAFPTRELITYELSISKDTFCKYKNELEKKGYIEVLKVKSNNGQFNNNLYEITSYPCPKKPDTDKPDTVLPDTDPPDTEIKDTTNNSLTSNNYINNNLTSNNKQYIPFQEIIEYLNLRTSSNFKWTTSKNQWLIKSRWDEKFNIDDFKIVIDRKSKEWLNTDQAKYLRPETLFGTKFEGYVNQKESISPKLLVKQTQISLQQRGRQYDVDELEKALLGRK